MQTSLGVNGNQVQRWYRHGYLCTSLNLCLLARNRKLSALRNTACFTGGLSRLGCKHLCVRNRSGLGMCEWSLVNATVLGEEKISWSDLVSASTMA